MSGFIQHKKSQTKFPIWGDLSGLRFVNEAVESMNF